MGKDKKNLEKMDGKKKTIFQKRKKGKTIKDNKSNRNVSKPRKKVKNPKEKVKNTGKKPSILDRLFNKKPKDTTEGNKPPIGPIQNPDRVVREANKKIFGGLGKKSKKQQENLQRQKDLHSVDKETRREIIRDQEGRIPLVFEEETQVKDRKPVGSFIRRGSKKKPTTSYTSEKQRDLARRYEEKRFEIIRQENDDYRPLHELNIWNKIRTAKRYRDEKSGKIAEREAAKQRKINEQKIKIESKIKREITEITDNIVNGEMEEASLEITIDPEHVDCLERVLMGDYFAMFRVEQKEPNPNLKVYDIYPPISLVFKRNLKRSEI